MSNPVVVTAEALAWALCQLANTPRKLTYQQTADELLALATEEMQREGRVARVAKLLRQCWPPVRETTLLVSVELPKPTMPAPAPQNGPSRAARATSSVRQELIRRGVLKP